MILSKLDLFSQPFLFKLNNNQLKKGTIQGFISSLGIFGIVFGYFIYLSIQFFGNKFDPVFRSQSFISNELIEVPLHENLVAFKMIQSLNQSLEQYQDQMNKTYIVPVATIGFQNATAYETIYLDIIKCSYPDLQNYSCLDFTKLSQKNLYTSQNEKLFSVISIFFYSCLVQDNVKQNIPQNCASQDDINNLVDSAYTEIHLKLFTQQYNITSKQNQINYKSFLISPSSANYYLNSQNVQNQITKVKDGLIIQSESQYSGPIQYIHENQSFPNDNNPYVQTNIYIDEVIQYTSIQFSTITEMLALVNSAFSALLFFGFFCTKFANKSIFQDFFCIFLQNMHQNLYEEVLKQNKLFEQNDFPTEIQTKLDQISISQENNCKDNTNNINIPHFKTKSREYVEQNQQVELNNNLTKYQDEILQPEEVENISPIADQQQIQENKERINIPYLSKQENEDNFFNYFINTTYSKEIRNSNKSYQNNLKESPINQLSQFNSESHQMSIEKPLNKINQPNRIQKNNQEHSYNSKFKKYISTKNNQQQGQDKKRNYLVDQKQNLNIKSDEISQANKINGNSIEYYIKKFKTVQDLNIFKQFTKINFGYRFTLQKLNIFKKNNREEELKTLSVQQKKFIEQQVVKSMSIIELLKDVIFVKKAIMMLMTKDQLAAMKLVGYSENYIQDHYQNQQFGKLKKKHSYFEKQLDIFDSTEISCQYIKQFILKCNNSQTLDKVDQRILSSIKKNQSNSIIN
ncbi:hypothetical protein ABPG74_012101 [Tetrahymena malaccensis]